MLPLDQDWNLQDVDERSMLFLLRVLLIEESWYKEVLLWCTNYHDWSG